MKPNLTHSEQTHLIAQPSTNSSSSSLTLTLAQLPQQSPSDMQFIFGFNVSTSQIMDLFQVIAHEGGYQLIESQQNHATAIKHNKKSFLQIIDCFNLWTEGNMTAVKMSVKNREKDSKRVCRIRGLVGSKKDVAEFIERFRVKSSALSTSKQIMQEDEQLQMSEQQTNPFYLQSCAAFMFHKILSNEKYGLGSQLHTAITNFNKQFKNSQESVGLMPLPMKKAIGIVEEIVSHLYKDFNYGRHEMQQIMPYCRISVQKYIFQKINPTIYAIYQAKNDKIINIYSQKRAKITTQLTPAYIFKQIGLAEKLWLSDPSDPSLAVPGNFLSCQTSNFYLKASKQLQRISGTQSPRQKVKHCQIMYTCLKTLVYEGTAAYLQCLELFNMEDIIPLLILVLLLTDIEGIKNQLDVMVDFIGFDPCDLEAQRRLLVNMSESFNYVSRDWKIE